MKRFLWLSVAITLSMHAAQAPHDDEFAYVERSDTGEIEVRSRPLTPEPIPYVHQPTPIMLPSVTVRDNVSVPQAFSPLNIAHPSDEEIVVPVEESLPRQPRVEAGPASTLSAPVAASPAPAIAARRFSCLPAKKFAAQAFRKISECFSRYNCCHQDKGESNIKSQ